MNDPIKELLAAGAIPTTSYPPTSRYHDAEVTAHDPGDGSAPVPHLTRRLCPKPERFAALYEATVIESDRRDTVAAEHLGDPELWWRIADANGAIDPRELTDQAGDMLRITLAVDIQGVPDD